VSNGYSFKLYEQNKAAADDKLGVRLGRVCIDKGISVIVLAERFGVTRSAVYQWFSGLREPQGRFVEPINAFLAEVE
jgi:transcriptional regulator with XRE-family HTH domain